MTFLTEFIAFTSSYCARQLHDWKSKNTYLHVVREIMYAKSIPLQLFLDFK